MSTSMRLCLPWFLSTLLPLASAIAQGNAPPASPGAPQATRVRGLSVTYEPLDPDQRQKEGVHSYRANLLSLAVERGETPTPLLPPGMFKATFRTVVVLPARDRMRFQIHGRGTVSLSVNGEAALSGLLRPGKPLETTEPVRLQKGDNQLVCTIESTAQGEAQLRVLWSGTDHAFEPLAPEVMTWAGDDPAIAAGELLRAGQQAFVEHRCARCHLPERGLGESAYSELDLPAPDLRSVGQRLHPGWIAKWLADPKAVRPDAVMPRMRAETAADAPDIAAYLATLGSPIAAPVPAADAAERGDARFRELGCIACHTPPAVPPDPVAGRRLSLAFVPGKWQLSGLTAYLLDPTHDHPGARMPHFDLQADDAAVLAAFLLQKPDPPAAVPGDIDRGRRLVTRHGCDRCHQLPTPDTGQRYQELRALHPEHGCLASSKQAPDFALSAEATAALRAFLPHAVTATLHRSPLDYAARLVPTLRCTNCHARFSAPSVWAELTLAATEPVMPEQDPIAQGLPALTWVGAKLQPGWIERFVTGREPSPRPWLHARMPSFGVAGSIVGKGLVREHGYPSQDEPEAPPDAQLAVHGARLIKMGDGLGCVQCHGNGQDPPVQVFERQGINFKVAAHRLRKEYYTRWLMNPLRIDPDARMPKYADDKGKTAITDVLGGDAAQQFEAIWHYFRTLQ